MGPVYIRNSRVPAQLVYGRSISPLSNFELGRDNMAKDTACASFSTRNRPNSFIFHEGNLDLRGNEHHNCEIPRKM